MRNWRSAQLIKSLILHLKTMNYYDKRYLKNLNMRDIPYPQTSPSSQNHGSTLHACCIWMNKIKKKSAIWNLYYVSINLHLLSNFSPFLKNSNVFMQLLIKPIHHQVTSFTQFVNVWQTASASYVFSAMANTVIPIWTTKK